jgi:hypothetical protein
MTPSLKVVPLSPPAGLKDYEPFRQSVRVMVVDYRPSIESEGRASKGKKWTPIGHEEDKGHR